MYIIGIIACVILIFYGKRIDEYFSSGTPHNPAYVTYENEYSLLLINFHTMKIYDTGNGFSELLMRTSNGGMQIKVNTYISSYECGHEILIKDGLINHVGLKRTTPFYDSTLKRLTSMLEWESIDSHFYSFVEDKYREYLNHSNKSRNHKIEDVWESIKYRSMPSS